MFWAREPRNYGIVKAILDNKWYLSDKVKQIDRNLLHVNPLRVPAVLCNIQLIFKMSTGYRLKDITRQL